MLNKISISKLSLILAIVIFGLIAAIYADDINTTVTIGNTAPTFTVAAAETVASDSTTPTNEGTNVVITATGTDNNSDDYYLLVCSTNSATPNNSAAPSCGATQYCVSSVTTSGNSATCTIDTNGNATENNAWFAFVCDNNSGAAACSTSNQGSGTTGSPFAVNHRPAFSGISENSPQDPGGTVTYTATASDSDTFGGNDTVELVVCKTAGVTGKACDGGPSDTWCESTASASNPTCDIALDAVLDDSSAYDAYVYIFDNHEFAANSATHGSNDSYTVNNVAPVVSNVVANGGSDVTLVENTTTSMDITGTVTDNNGCSDISSATGSFAHSILQESGTEFNDCLTGSSSYVNASQNFCYNTISCSVDAGTCTGGTDSAATYTCTVSLHFNAEASDATSLYAIEAWIARITASDEALSGSANASPVEINTLLGYDVTASIAYGSLSVGQSNDPLDRITTYTNTGNVRIDALVSGTDMLLNGVGPESIAVGNQEHSLNSSTAYGSGIDLTGSPFDVEINLNKTFDFNSPLTSDVYWGLLIPGATVPGTYTGTNTLEIKLDD